MEKIKKEVAFVISRKENEKRRALLPSDIFNIKNISNVYVEKGYGEVLGINDEDYEKLGIKTLSRDEALKKDIICDPKIGDAEYISELKDETIIFGWIHAVKNKDLTNLLLKKRIKAIAWEDMYENNRHTFWLNNIIAGRASVLHAFTLYGKFPHETKVAILGKGNTAMGAYETLSKLGADVTIYDRGNSMFLRNKIDNYDVIVNAVLWDVDRKDHIIYKKDLLKMKPNSMIIDISCDLSGAIETSIPTSIEKPTYITDGVLHYVVDHTPALFPHSVSKELSLIISKQLDLLIEGENNEIINNATIISMGEIIDDKIKIYQQRTTKI